MEEVKFKIADSYKSFNFYLVGHKDEFDRAAGIRKLRGKTITLICNGCGAYLHVIYSIIMKDLSEANLLPKNYKHLCCDCYNGSY